MKKIIHAQTQTPWKATAYIRLLTPKWTLVFLMNFHPLSIVHRRPHATMTSFQVRQDRYPGCPFSIGITWYDYDAIHTSTISMRPLIMTVKCLHRMQCNKLAAAGTRCAETRTSDSLLCNKERVALLLKFPEGQEFENVYIIFTRWLQKYQNNWIISLVYLQLIKLQ